MRRPDANEYAEYYGLYIGKVPGGDVLEVLRGGVGLTAAALDGLAPERERYRYQPGKWSLREVLGHVIDVERVFSFRALSFARRDPSRLPSMDQDVWAAGANAEARTVVSLLHDLACARASSLAILDSLPGDAWDRRGTASGCEFTVRACAYILAGHEIHHRRVLVERYLPS
jgi:DinB superfamily